mmetsp:Transcript_29156/g.52763  ORF Transcript_29156/g.52763 Transcript_29156/m.52763 type:complete len:92 (+) Transcript_29156:92-367(+)
MRNPHCTLGITPEPYCIACKKMYMHLISFQDNSWTVRENSSYFRGDENGKGLYEDSGMRIVVIYGRNIVAIHGKYQMHFHIHDLRIFFGCG